MHELIDVFLNYLSVERGLSKNTIISYRQDLETFLDYLKAKQHIGSLEKTNRSHITSFMLSLKEKGLSANSISRKLAAIKTFYRFLVREKLILQDPTSLLESPKLWKRIPNTLSLVEIETLISQPNLHRKGGARDRAILEILYATGMRVSEVAQLRLQDLNLDVGFVRCLGKGNKERIVPLGKKAITSLNRYIEKERPYFSRRANIPKGSNSFVIENGIPRLNFNGVSALQKDFESNAFFENAFIVGGIGRLSKEKGFNYLIEAMSPLLNQYDYRLVIIGEGNQKSQLERLINQKGLINRVHLYGYRQNAFKYLPLFDVFVLPSLTEGLPIILLEAMQAETPIVATRVGGVPRVLGNGQNGMLVEPGNPVALTKAILNLRNNQDVTREKARKAKEVALAKYSSARMAGDYLKVYEGVLRNRPIREENI